MQDIKLVVVGDGGVGKSSLLIRYTSDNFPSEYIPTVFDNFTSQEMYHGKMINLSLFDTAGQEDYDRLRPLAYPQTDVFLVCFALDSMSSFENVESKWLIEVNYHLSDVPILLVGCKSDQRYKNRETGKTSDNPGPSSAEIRDLAKRMRMTYVQTSALRAEGVQDCFDKAIEAVLTQNSPSKKKRRKWNSLTKHGDDIPQAPVMPPAGKAPWIEIETSLFQSQWQTELWNPIHTDVVFTVERIHKLRAHRVILCSAATYFRKVFDLSAEQPDIQNQLSMLDEGYSRTALETGLVPGIASLRETCDEKSGVVITHVQISDDVTLKTFAFVLQFIYTGVPSFSEDTTDEEVRLVSEAAAIFQLPELETICRNVQKGDDFLNASIGTFWNDESCSRLKKMFFNKSSLSDITYKVEGKLVYAHKAVLSARSDVMSAMLGGNFSEGSSGESDIPIGDVSLDNFMALLEYIYTDHSPIDGGDEMGILALADRYCLSRLVTLCELYVTKSVDRACRQNISTSTVDVIRLLLFAQIHNARQLEDWCLHFISTNYLVFSQRPEFSLLTGHNRDYIDENRWPPLGYLRDAEQYEKLVGGKVAKCAVM